MCTIMRPDPEFRAAEFREFSRVLAPRVLRSSSITLKMSHARSALALTAG